MCPQCRAFITTDDKVCPYCDAPVGARAIDVRNPADVLGGLIPHAHFTTVLILLVNLGIYVATAIFAMQAGRHGGFMDIDSGTLYLFGAKFAPSILRGEWWRLITASYLHGGLMHIGMNLWVLYDLGAQVEEAYGTARFLAIYFVTGITGFYASMLWLPMVPSVGASAPLFGLIGAMIALGVRSKTSQGMALRSFYMRWAVYGLVMGFILPHVDNGAHLGGLAGGFAMGFVTGAPRIMGPAENFWKVIAGLCIAATVWAIAQAIRFMLVNGSQL